MYNTAKHGEVVAKSRRLSYEHKNNGTSQSKGLFEMWEVLIGKGIRGVSEYFEGKGTSWMSEMDRTKAVGINADNLIFSDVNPCPKFVGL